MAFWTSLRLPLHLYINLACLSVCCLCPINVKTAEPIRPKFCMEPHVAPRKVFGQSDFTYVILKFVYLKLFRFVKFLKCAKKILMKSANKKNYTVLREDAHRNSHN